MRSAAGRKSEAALAGLILVGLLALAWHSNLKPRHDAFRAVPDVLRALAGTVVVFGLGGFGLVRLMLPSALRRYELLWVLPIGGCAVGLAMTVLGFAGVPYPVSLPLVLVAGAALGAYAVRRRGWPQTPIRRLAWPLYLAFVVLAVALVPVLFRAHLAVPVGTGSDAHVATGVAQLLKHAYPTSIDISQPINRVPQTWQSKFPIYYAFAAVSSLSGLGTWQVLSTLAAVLLAMASIGMFLVAREVFGAPAAVALVAMVLAGLDRMALHTVLNPYFNQTWGYFAMPFSLVLGWRVVQPGTARGERRATLVLLALFVLVLAFAYPLAAPIPAVPIAVFLWSQRRRRIAAGERVFHLRDLYRGRRSLLWIAPLAVLLGVPAIGVIQKAAAAIQVLSPGHSLQSWGGDLRAFIPFDHFFSLPSSPLGSVLFVGVIVLTIRELRRQPRALAVGLGGLLVIALLLSAYLHHRPYGFYFHFKLLAFTGPLVLLIAVLGAGRLRRVGVLSMAVLTVATVGSTIDELGATGFQLSPWSIELGSWARSLPQNASVRLDMWPPNEIWAAYFMDSRRLCSQLPLLQTDYAHVPISTKADYIVVTLDRAKPADAVGPPLRQNSFARLFRESPRVRGVDYCSKQRLDRIYTGRGHSTS